MERKGHYVKRARRVTVPAVAFSVVVEPHLLDVAGDPDCVARSWSSAAAWCARRVNGVWRRPEELVTADPDELTVWMHARGRKDARNYVVCPVASDVLTLSGFWLEAESAGVKWEPVRGKLRRPPEDGTTRFRRLVLRGKPDIVDYTRYGYRWVWLSLAQYLPATEEELARSLNLPWIDTGHLDASGTVGPRTARERARVILGAFTGLTDWWGRHAKAPWGFTAGQLAMGLLRTHTEPRTLCTHSLDGAHRLERSACFGGRASVWYVGDVGDPAAHDSFVRPAPKRSRYGSTPGPLHLIDVRSMYPWLLREQEFPCKLRSYRHDYRVRDVVAAARSYGVIAEVEVETERAEYPRRVGDRVTYPVGRFAAILTAPEIEAVQRCGRIVSVGRAAVYDIGPVFRAAAGELIAMRERARASGDCAMEFFAKLMGNSLGGKLAQHAGQWHERRKIPPVVQWGEWVQGRDRSGKPRKFRAIAGLVWEYVRDQSGAGPHTAAFAHLTALGRMYMAALRARCPMGSVVSQDTDGLWVTDAGLAAIRAAGYAFGDRAGELKVAATVAAARFFGPRHYWTPDGWVLAGFHDPTVMVDGSSVTDTRTDNPVRRSTDGPPLGVFTRTRRSALTLDIPGQLVDPDGWCTPKRLGQGI